MTTLSIDSIGSRHSTSRDPSPKARVALALQTAGEFVLTRPRLACVIVLPLALMLGSLVGLGLDGIGREPPPALIRLAP
jgi:hypothetical protein